MRVLLVEDDPKLGPTLAKLLKQQSYSVDLVKDGLKAKEKVIDQQYDIILLDINLPGADGIEVCKTARNNGVKTPVLMLTSRDQITDKIRGFDTGADDYLTKPFNTGELFARMRALLRRPDDILPATLSFEKLSLNPADRTVLHGRHRVELMPKEFSLLEYLMRNSERAVSRDELLRHVWGVYSNNSSNRLEVYIRYLRRKIDKPFSTKYVKTIRGIGYKLARQR
jgi:DNA-binding response OmpR family regulator